VRRIALPRTTFQIQVPTLYRCQVCPTYHIRSPDRQSRVCLIKWCAPFLDEPLVQELFPVMNKILTIAALCCLIAVSSLTLAAGDPAAGKQKAVTCAGCHGVDGNSMNGEWPKLAGQHVKYLVKQLQNFKNMERVNNIMNGMAMPLSQQDMEDIAAYYEEQALQPGVADPALVEQGRRLYQGGNLESDLPACMACHGPNGVGNPAAGFPSLAGQHAQYLQTQLHAFRAMERANDPAMMMRNVAAKMTDEEIQAVSSYIQGLR